MIEDPEGTLLAAAPMYVKGHSAGEFVFDHQWASVAQYMGVRYYPKGIVAVPFTPSLSASLPARLLQPP